MSHLTDNPELMVEALAVLVRKMGGQVTIRPAEAPGPFNLLSKFDDDGLHLLLDEDITDEQVDLLISNGS